MKVVWIAAAVAAAVFAGPAAAQQSLAAHLTGAAEKPNPADPDGMGHAMLKVDTSKNQVCYDITVEKIGTATMAHIHKAGPDAAGPVAVPLKAPDASGKVKDCATADAAVVKDIAQNPGSYYVNVHNAEYPAGAIRGQISK